MRLGTQILKHNYQNNCVVFKWEVSSVGRASPLQGECRRFEPVTSYQTSSCSLTVEHPAYIRHLSPD